MTPRAWRKSRLLSHQGPLRKARASPRGNQEARATPPRAPAPRPLGRPARRGLQQVPARPRARQRGRAPSQLRGQPLGDTHPRLQPLPRARARPRRHWAARARTQSQEWSTPPAALPSPAGPSSAAGGLRRSRARRRPGPRLGARAPSPAGPRAASPAREPPPARAPRRTAGRPRRPARALPTAKATRRRAPRARLPAKARAQSQRKRRGSRRPRRLEVRQQRHLWQHRHQRRKAGPPRAQLPRHPPTDPRPQPARNQHLSTQRGQSRRSQS
mmetsp:Transcript_24161/g.76579  ORF Transcript_24161/g.76579 Transcript_24161/m.76579 type:complete len:272 (+) Transcript_24161:1046-1861(+)